MDYLKSWVLCGLMAVSFTAFGQIYDGLEFVGPASDCALTPDFSDVFNIAPPIVSGQNTTDTQSKLSIGDVDCDGIPDVIFVSKWAQAIKVMATTDNQPLDGADEGDIKSEYNTPGKKIFPTGKGFDSQWYFEMEIAIGNIDGACDLSNPGANPAEIFAFASNRKNADDIPSNFALTGFNYSGATLEPIPGWCGKVPLLGSQRPGEMGLADFDGDGLVEIFFKNVIYSAETGCLLAQGPALDWDTQVTSAPVAVDLIPGGNMELVSGNIVYSVPDLSAARAACNPCTQSYAPASLSVTADMNSLGQGQWYPKEIYDPNEYGYDNFSSTSVADVNNDGYLDVVLSGALDSKNGETAVFYWDVQNSIVSYYLPKDPLDPTGLGWEWGTSRPNLGEIDGDGKLEITFIAGNQLYALEEVNGVLVEKWLRTINDSRSGIVATTVYDFNNDGNPEIVYRDSQQLTIIDGATGQETLWATTCQSHTMTEGPVIADVNGDGQTDLCVACNRNNSFDINAGLQQQALGEMRCFFSESNSWLPTRQVWNQTGYFITNITDDLTIPTEQVGMNTVLSDGSCPNGLPGPQKPFNTFLNQVPYLNADGCPVFPGPDLAFFGQDPLNPTLPPTDPNYFPAIELIPPTCGDFGLTVLFNIINDGDLPITDNIPVSFWEGDPTTDPGAKLLNTDVLSIVALGVGDTIRTPSKKFTGPGYEFPLYIVLNDNGSTAPIIDLTAKLAQECSIDNNVLGIMVTPEPYEILAQMTNNFTCDPNAPTNGQITSQVFKNGIQITTFTDYKFEWFSGANYETLIPGATGPTISGLPAGDYSLKVTNTVAGCVSSPDFPMTILDDSPQPDVTLVKNSDQTNCTPANGELELVFGGTDIGYTFKWYDQNLTLLPNTAKILTGLVGGTYTVEVVLDGCAYPLSETVLDLSLNPEASAVATGVSSCIDPNTGTVTATALEAGVAAADQTNFTFDWHYSSDGLANVGSILPPENGTGATRTALPIGFYAVYVTNNTTSCQSLPAFVEVTDDTTFPDVAIYEIQPQTSCDPTAPNGILGAQILDAFGNPIADISTFTFEWFEGDNTLPANLHTITSGTKGEIAENIKGGGIPYTVKVTNPNGCFTSTFFVISEQNTPPEVTLTLLDPNTVCDPVLAALGQFTGRIQATVTDNGVPVTLPNPDYVFTWYQGTTTAAPQEPVADNTDPILSAQEDGNYTVTVTKTGVNCTSAPYTLVIPNQQVSPILVETVIPATNCTPDGVNNGEATVLVNEVGNMVSDGYAYTWYTGSVVDIANIYSNTTGINNETGIELAPNGQYTVEVRNIDKGCSNTVTFTVPDNSILPVVTLTPAPNSICDPALNYNGSITASVSDGNNPPDPVVDFSIYEFTWKDNVGNDVLTSVTGSTATDNVISNIPGGTYEVTVKNTVLGCTSDPVQVVVNDVLIYPLIDLTPTPSTNCDPALPNGSIVAAVDEAGVLTTTGYTFAWYDGAGTTTPLGVTTPDINNINGGQDYTVQVENIATGCISELTIFLNQDIIKPVITLSQLPNSICDEALGFNGTITASVDDVNGAGVPVVDFTNYTFTWVQTVGSYTGLASATSIPNSDNTTPNILDKVPAGTYEVTITNNLLGCTSDPAVVTVVDDTEPPVISITPTPSTNCDPAVPNGSLAAAVTESNPPVLPYVFVWEDEFGNNVGNTQVVNNLQGGITYNVTVTNPETGCIGTQIIALPDNSALPVLVLVADENAVCGGGTDLYSGTITASVDDANGGGVPVVDFTNYTFTWQQTAGNFVGDATAITGSDNSVKNILDNLPEGEYEVTVTNDLLGCTSAPIPVTIIFNPILPDIIVTPIPSTNCAGTGNGELSAEVNVGGVPTTTGFTFTWYSGNTVDPLNLIANTSSIVNLQGGLDYTVHIKNDLTGCENFEIVTLDDASAIPVMTLSKVDNTTCGGGSDLYTGKVVATVNDINGAGVPVVDFTDYTFTWTQTAGNFVGDVLVTLAPEGIDNSTKNIIDKIPEGTYSVVVENTVLGCISDPVEITVGFIPTYPLIAVVPTPSTNCVGGGGAPNGSFAATVDGGANPTDYEWSWYSGNTADPANQLVGFTSNFANGLQGGGGVEFTVKLKNKATGCENTRTVLLQDASVIHTIAIDYIIENEVCDPGLGFNGQIFVTVDYAGNDVTADPDYTYFWYEGKVVDDTKLLKTGTAEFSVVNQQAGFYTVLVVNDVLGCVSDPVTVELTDNVYYPDITSTVVNQTSCDPTAPNGSVSITIDDAIISGTNDPAEYTFVWFESIDNTNFAPLTQVVPSGINGENIVGVQGNTFYKVVVTRNTSGCDNEVAVFLPEIITLPDPVLSVTSDMTICGPTPDGALDATVNGIAVGYDFYWYDGRTSDQNEVITNYTQLTSDNGAFPDLISGEYTLVVYDRYNKCYSNPETIEVPDLTIPITIAIAIDNVPTSCSDNIGQMTANPTGPSALATDYNYEWYNGGPVNSNDIDFRRGVLPVFDPVAPPFATTQTVSGLTSGIYTIVVEHIPSGCKEFKTHFLPFTNAHNVALTSTPSNLCNDPVNGDGTIVIQISDPIITDPLNPPVDKNGNPYNPDNSDYIINVYEGTTDQVASAVLVEGFSGLPADEVPITVFGGATPSLAPGWYTVEVIETYTGADCPVYQTIEVLSPVVEPIIDIVGSITPSTTCDINIGDGAFTVNIGPGLNDDLTDTYDINVSPAVTGYPITLSVGTLTSFPRSFSNLAEGTYTVTVTGNVGAIVGCTVTRDITITSQPKIGEIVDSGVIVTNAEYCAPSGSIEVTELRLVGASGTWDPATNYVIGNRIFFNNQVYSSLVDNNLNNSPDTSPVQWSLEVETLNDYEFVWYNSSALDAASEIFRATGDATAAFGGEMLNIDNLPTIGAGDYWVVATKINGPGTGCSTAPIKKTIEDKSVDPVLALTASVNTSCDEFNGEGTITISVSTPSGPGIGFDYDYLVTGPNLFSFAGTGNGDGSSLDFDDDVLTGLLEGQYTVSATNQETGCFIEQKITIIKNTQPVFILKVDQVNPDKCLPSGTMEVLEVSYDNANIAPLTNFDFEWYRGDPNSAPLVDANGDQINASTLVAGNNANEYPDLGPDTYYVIAISKVAPGVNCRSANETINLLDDSANPTIVYTTVPNNSCLPDVADGEIDITMSDPYPVAGTFSYDWISWTDLGGTKTTFDPLDPTNASAPSMPDDRASVTNNELFTGLQSGTYEVQVLYDITGCSINSVITVNDVPILPEIGTITPVPDTYCVGGSGSITVDGTLVSITDGGVTTNIPVDQLIIELFTDVNLTTSVLVDADAVYDAGAGTKTWSGIEAGDYFFTASISDVSVYAGKGCTNPPIPVTILSQTVTPSNSPQAYANTSCDPANYTGAFDINYSVPATSTGANTTFEITFTNIPAGTTVNGLDDSSLPIIVSGIPVVGGSSVFSSLVTDNVGPGVYEYEVKNETSGCTSLGSVTVPNQEVKPDLVSFTPVQQTFCSPANGQIIININDIKIGGVAIASIAEVTLTLTDAGAVSYPYVDNDPLFPNSAVFSDLAFGKYELTVLKNSGVKETGAGCTSPPFPIELLDDTVDPTLSVTTSANTACLLVNPTGSIVMTIDNGLAPASSYTVNWLSALDPNGNVIPDPTVFNNLPGNKIEWPDLPPGTYTFEIINDDTQCSIPGTATIEDNPIYPQIAAFTPTAQTICDPADASISIYDGDIEIDGIDIPVSELNIDLFESDGVTTAGLKSTGTDPIKGNFVIFNQLITGSYKVVVTRTTGSSLTGEGCPSAPFTVNLLDERAYPALGLTSTSNTACTGDFDGSITLGVTDPVGSAGFGSLYTYDIIKIGDPAVNFNFTGNSGDGSVADGDNDILTGLQDGTYRVTVLNENTLCSITGDITILKQPQVIDVTTPVVLHQFICDPDGSIEVTAVSPTDINSYSFLWYKDTYTVGQELVNPGTGLVITDKLLNVTNYPTIGAGTYYVVAVKDQNVPPGSGCPSDPIPVIIEDRIVYPTLIADFTANTACEPNYYNGTITATANDPNDAAPVWDFVWSYTGANDPSATVATTVAGDVWELTGASDGDYLITVTNTNSGCTFDQLVTVTLNQPASFPNIVFVSTIDPVNCNPTASATVESVSVGGGAPVTDPIALDAEFSYEWYYGSVDPANQVLDAGGVPVTSITANNLQVGSYFVLVKSELTGCKGLEKEVVIKDSDIIYPEVVIVQTIPQVNCVQPWSGELTSTADGQDDTNLNYQFTWYLSSDAAMTPIAQTSTISNLPADDYTVEVFNTLTGCTATARYIIEDFSMEFLPIVNWGAVPNTHCLVPNGEVMATYQEFQSNNPAYPYLLPYDYTFDWWEGTNPDFATAPFRADVQTATGLAAGIYTLRVFDNNTQCYTVVEVEVTESKAPPTVQIFEDSPLINCDPARPNGQMSIIVDAGQRPFSDYDIAWYAGGTATGTVLGTNEVMVGLTAGNYTANVIDKRTGCEIAVTGIVTDGQLPAPTPDPEVLAHDTSCIDDNGVITVTVGGETFGYTFQWYDGPTVNDPALSSNVNVYFLDPGIYTVVAKDIVTGCESAPASIEVLDMTLIPEITFESGPSVCLTPSGFVEAKITNGAIGQSFDWSYEDGSISSGPGWYNVPAGTYSITVTSVEGCVSQSTMELGTITEGYQLITPDKGTNDFFYIDCIEDYPDNNVKVFTRTGVLVYEAYGYNNLDVIFNGVGKNGIYFMGDFVPDGTYFYIIDRDGDKGGIQPEIGFIEILRN